LRRPSGSADDGPGSGWTTRTPGGSANSRGRLEVHSSMPGWRARIGYITPTVMEVVSYDFYRFAPDGVALVGVTCGIDDWRPEEFERGLAQVGHFARYLGERGVDFVIHGGGPLVVSRGPGYEATIVEAVSEAAGVPATTSVRSGMEALRHLGARRVAIASPYPDAHNAALAGHLVANGFDVALAVGRDLPFKQIQDDTPDEIRTFALAAAADAERGGWEALYLPCPQWRASETVASLEAETGRPAVTSTHANAFAAFRSIGLRDHIEGHGRLLGSIAEL